jgi:hypothetical protein
MARRLRFNGTGSGEGGCPAVHEDLDTGEVIVHGPALTDPTDVARLKHLGPGEVPIVVPRELLVDFGPKEADRVPRIIDLDAFGRLFEIFEHTAWRLETRTRYASDEATDTYAQFARGDEPTWDLGTPWSLIIRDKTAGGAGVGRVRIVDSPPTDGRRYLLAHARKNAALGEDVQCLGRAEAQRLQLPEEDFWIFDSRLVALLNFDAHDDLISVELITEPVAVNRYAQARDAARHYAVPYETYA